MEDKAKIIRILNLLFGDVDISGSAAITFDVASDSQGVTLAAGLLYTNVYNNAVEVKVVNEPSLPIIEEPTIIVEPPVIEEPVVVEEPPVIEEPIVETIDIIGEPVDPEISIDPNENFLIGGGGFPTPFQSDFDTPSRFGQSIKGSEYIESQDVDGSPTKTIIDDDFAGNSHPVLALGQPNVFTTDKDCYIDIYAFHGSGIKEVAVSAGNGPYLSATLVSDEKTDEYGGHYRVAVSKQGIQPGSDVEIRATAIPNNGYTRTVQMKLRYTKGENAISIDPSISISETIRKLSKVYDRTKRNVVRLVKNGKYKIGSTDRFILHDYGWIEVEAAEGVTAIIDVSYGSNNYNVRPRLHQIKWNNIVFRSMVNFDDPDTFDRMNGGIYTEDQPHTTRWWFDGCRTESNWFSEELDGTPLWKLTDDDKLPKSTSIARNAYDQQFFYTNCFDSESYNGYGGARLIRGCRIDRNYQDVASNAHAMINSSATRKLNPYASSRHSDHFQLYAGKTDKFINTQGEEFEEVAPVMNKLLYGYTGHDEYQYVQQFGFFGTRKEYYSDIAHVKCRWTGVQSEGGIAQIGIKYDHILNIDLESENGGLTYRADGKQYGPCLIADVKMQSLSNGTISPLNMPEGVNEFRGRGIISPPMQYTGTPTDDSNLNTEYSWTVSPESLGEDTKFGNLYIKDGIGEDSLSIGTKATNADGKEIHLAEVFGLDPETWNEKSRFAYSNAPSGQLGHITLTCFPTRKSAKEWVESAGESGWWMKITTDRGFAYTKVSANLRGGSSKLVNLTSFNMGSLGGTPLEIDEILKSKTGITFELKKL